MNKPYVSMKLYLATMRCIYTFYSSFFGKGIMQSCSKESAFMNRLFNVEVVYQ